MLELLGAIFGFGVGGAIYPRICRTATYVHPAHAAKQTLELHRDEDINNRVFLGPKTGVSV